MPGEEAEKYLRREWIKTQYLSRQFYLEVRSCQIKYCLSFAAFLLILFLLVFNLSVARITEDHRAILLLGLIGLICFWAGVYFWIRYHDLNG